VSKELGISLNVTLKIRQKGKENVSDPEIGRPQKVSRVARRVLATQFNTGKMTDLHNGQRLVKSTEGVQVHTRSIKSCLRKEVLKGYIQQWKPELNKEQLEAWYKFAEGHSDWILDDRKKLCFQMDPYQQGGVLWKEVSVQKT
ncbi:hypothetical protein BGZ49_010065, partial [Haplosporangium sp. Z 27]